MSEAEITNASAEEAPVNDVPSEVGEIDPEDAVAPPDLDPELEAVMTMQEANVAYGVLKVIHEKYCGNHPVNAANVSFLVRQAVITACIFSKELKDKATKKSKLTPALVCTLARYLVSRFLLVRVLPAVERQSEYTSLITYYEVHLRAAVEADYKVFGTKKMIKKFAEIANEADVDFSAATPDIEHHAETDLVADFVVSTMAGKKIHEHLKVAMAHMTAAEGKDRVLYERAIFYLVASGLYSQQEVEQTIQQAFRDPQLRGGSAYVNPDERLAITVLRQLCLAFAGVEVAEPFPIASLHINLNRSKTRIRKNAYHLASLLCPNAELKTPTKTGHRFVAPTAAHEHALSDAIGEIKGNAFAHTSAEHQKAVFQRVHDAVRVAVERHHEDRGLAVAASEIAHLTNVCVFLITRGAYVLPEGGKVHFVTDTYYTGLTPPHLSRAVVQDHPRYTAGVSSGAENFLEKIIKFCEDHAASWLAAVKAFYRAHIQPIIQAVCHRLAALFHKARQDVQVAEADAKAIATHVASSVDNELATVEGHIKTLAADHTVSATSLDSVPEDATADQKQAGARLYDKVRTESQKLAAKVSVHQSVLEAHNVVNGVVDAHHNAVVEALTREVSYLHSHVARRGLVPSPAPPQPQPRRVAPAARASAASANGAAVEDTKVPINLAFVARDSRAAVVAGNPNSVRNRLGLIARDNTQIAPSRQITPADRHAMRLLFTKGQ